jgi:hypothetical protein
MDNATLGYDDDFATTMMTHAGKGKIMSIEAPDVRVPV